MEKFVFSEKENYTCIFPAAEGVGNEHQMSGAFFYIRAQLKCFIVNPALAPCTALLQIIVSSKDLVPASVSCREKEACSLYVAVRIHRYLLVGSVKKRLTLYNRVAQKNIHTEIPSSSKV